MMYVRINGKIVAEDSPTVTMQNYRRELIVAITSNMVVVGIDITTAAVTKKSNKRPL